MKLALKTSWAISIKNLLFFPRRGRECAVRRDCQSTQQKLELQLQDSGWSCRQRGPDAGVDPQAQGSGRLCSKGQQLHSRHVCEADHAVPRLPSRTGHPREGQGHQGPHQRPHRGSGAGSGPAHQGQRPYCVWEAEVERGLPFTSGCWHCCSGSTHQRHGHLRHLLPCWIPQAMGWSW